MMKGHYVGALIDLLVETGVDRAQFLQLCGVRESELTSDNLIDQERVYRVTELTVQHSKNPAVGAFAGQRLNINTHGPLGYAAMASEDLEHALHLLVRYYKVQAPRARFELHHQGSHLHLICEPSFDTVHMPWMTAEFLVSSIFTSTDFLLNGRLQGVEICFRFSRPPHADQYPTLFRVPCRFDQSFNGLLIPWEVAKQPLMSADAVAASIFEKRCESMRKDVESVLLSERILDIQTRRAGDFLSQSEIAQRLNLSVSTLHRKLAEEGLSYKALIADIKKKIAIQHLTAGLLNNDQIAHLLGFSDASNFRRAFVNWTGKNPSDYRLKSDDHHKSDCRNK